MYSDLYFQKRRTNYSMLLAGFVAVIFTGFGLYYFLGQASGSQASRKPLTEHKIVNLSFNQAGVYWQTEEAEPGWITYGEMPDKLDKTASDPRYKKDKEPAHLHLVTLNNLKPGTTYYYEIVSEEGIYQQEDGAPFSFTTTDQFNLIGASKPAYGKVTEPTGDPAVNALIFITHKDSVPLVTYTKSTGEWLIPLTYVINEESMKPISLAPDDELKVHVVGETLKKSTVQILVNKTNPFPQTIVLGNNYSFLNEENVLPASTSIKQEQEESARTDEAEPINTDTVAPVPQNTNVSILFPQDSAVIPGSRPLIKGLAIPGSVINLSISSNPPYSFQITVPEDGEWLVNVPQGLLPGTYILTLYANDASGVPLSINRQFTIAKSGEQVLGDATGSASEPSPTVAPQEPTATRVPTVAATDIPTSVPSPTVLSQPSSSPAVPQDISPTLAVSTVTPISNNLLPTATPAPPVSGGNGLLYTFTALGLLILGATAVVIL